MIRPDQMIIYDVLHICASHILQKTSSFKTGLDIFMNLIKKKKTHIKRHVRTSKDRLAKRTRWWHQTKKIQSSDDCRIWSLYTHIERMIDRTLLDMDWLKQGKIDSIFSHRGYHQLRSQHFDPYMFNNIPFIILKLSRH